MGHGPYQATRESRAEIALEVGDSMQGQGLGTILIDHLAAAATEAGITVFEAEVMITNHRMRKVFRDTGFRISTSSADGGISIATSSPSRTHAASRGSPVA